MTQRYPLLVATLGLSLGAVVGGSLRLTDAERGLAGPLSREVKKRALDIADERYGEFVESAEQLAGSLKARLGAETEPKDLSSDFETVLGGGPPPVQEREGTAPRSAPVQRPITPAGGLA